MPSWRHFLEGLQTTGILLQLIICLKLASGDTAENGDVVKGSCFKERREQGNCFGLLSNFLTKAECCERNGFFVNRQISNDEYLFNELLFKYGTPYCVSACYEEITPTCEGYRCAYGHTCQLVDNQPKCVCHLSCSPSDYLSGPVCSKDHRFENRCLLKQAVCLSQVESVEERPCPKEAARCAPDSVFPRQCVGMLHSIITREKRVHEEYDNPWLFGDLGKQLYAFGVELFNQNARTFQMQRRRYSNRPSTNDQYRRRHDKRSGDTERQRGSYLGWKFCPAGEYCLIRQHDSQPACIPMTLTESVILNGCPQEGIFPEPLCGVDNQTYVDACQLREASLKKQMEVRIAYRGSCRKDANCSSVRCLRDGMRCRPHHETQQPVCLDCNELPKNCNIPSAFREEGVPGESRGSPNAASSLVGSLGDPRWSTDTMTTGWPHVCGSNGMTFPNTCFLHVFNCFSPVFVELSTPGLCPGRL